jgi:hypothetical protein
MATTTCTVPRAAVLDTWAKHRWAEGCQLDAAGSDLKAGPSNDLRALRVVTMNSVYELIVTCAATGDVRVRGGAFFPDWRAARVAGSSLGGSFLKLRGIYPGFCLELYADGLRIVTSPVRSVGWEGTEQWH